MGAGGLTVKQVLPRGALGGREAGGGACALLPPRRRCEQHQHRRPHGQRRGPRSAAKTLRTFFFYINHGSTRASKGFTASWGRARQLHCEGRVGRSGRVWGGAADAQSPQLHGPATRRAKVGQSIDDRAAHLVGVEGSADPQSPSRLTPMAQPPARPLSPLVAQLAGTCPGGRLR